MTVETYLHWVGYELRDLPWGMRRRLLAELAEQGSDTNPSNDQWHDFIVGYLDKYAQAVVIGYSHSEVIAEVDRYLGAWDIANVMGDELLRLKRCRHAAD